MAVQLPLQTLPRTQIRILVREVWSDNLGDWQELPYFTQRRGGYILENCEQVSLPASGQAIITYEFGRFVTRGGVQVVGADQSGSEGWDPGSDSITAADLTNYVVLIQAADTNETDRNAIEWNDIYLGAVEYWQDQLVPAANVPDGRRVYYLVDLWTHFSRRWTNTHYTYAAPTSGGRTVYPRCVGPARYNEQVRGIGYAIGNRSTGANDYYAPPWAADASQRITAHAQTGTADTDVWTDAQVIQHQINNSRGPDDPWFQFVDTAASGTGDTVFSGSNVWHVAEVETVFSVVAKVADRRRGRGTVRLEWTRSGDSITALQLRAYPQVAGDISYPDIDDSTVTIPGADTNATTVTADLIGDHRLVDGSFKISQRHMTQCDYLETVGEYIEVLTTLSYTDTTWQEGWDTGTYETEFNGETAENRKGDQYDALYHLHRIPRDWDGKAGDGNGAATRTPVYWRCDDDGELTNGFGSSQDYQIARASASEYEVDVAPDRIVIERDLPILAGYDYTTDAVVRYDGQDEQGTPKRREIMVFLQDEATEDGFVDFKTVQSPQLVIAADGVFLSVASDKRNGTRLIGDTAESIGSTYDYTNLGLTVSLRMPHRVRLATASPSFDDDRNAQSARRKRIYIPGIRLHLAHEQAIWNINGDGTVDRECAGATASAPGIIRDDRNQLKRIHALAEAWYLENRQNVQWDLKACGLLPTFEVVEQADSGVVQPPDGQRYTTPATTTEVYPQVGELITTLAASGQSQTINCPVTRVRYDHTRGQTSWTCDWVELDFRRA